MNFTTLKYLVAAGLLSLTQSADAQTVWPRFQGVFIQKTNGEHVELPSLRYHSTQDHEAFQRSVLASLPRLKPDEIDAIIFHNIEYASEYGQLDVEWGFLVDKVDDPTHYCAINCKGDLVISSWSVKLEAFNVEFGPKHTSDYLQVAMYQKEGAHISAIDKTGTNGGSDPHEIPIQPVILKGPCCYGYWGFIIEAN